MSLLDRRLNIITGKGGVGKSTLSAAMALASQARGKRTLVCEVTAQEQVSRLLGARASGTDVQQVDKNIWSVHIRPEEAMREYGIMVLRFKALYSAVFENRLVRYFVRAVPSLPEIVMLGKIWWHVTQDRDESGKLRWDQVILDAPATGHGLSFLGTPQTILEIVDEGPMVRDMKNMHAMILDPKITAVSVVALPEEMPVNEAIELNEGLSKRLSLPGGRVFLNGFMAPRFSAEERANLAASDSPEIDDYRRVAHAYGARQDLSAFYLQRLKERVSLPMTCLPYLPGETFGRSEVERLAAILGQEL
jgi:anion-transporting  ArsA/GET3 family ATPase